MLPQIPVQRNPPAANHREILASGPQILEIFCDSIKSPI